MNICYFIVETDSVNKGTCKNNYCLCRVLTTYNFTINKTFMKVISVIRLKWILHALIKFILLQFWGHLKWIAEKEYEDVL